MGVLIVSDTAATGCSNWGLRQILAEMAPVLVARGFAELAGWLTSETSSPHLFKSLDVRQLSPENRLAFRQAIRPTLERLRERGPAEHYDPADWEGVVRLFENLADQVELNRAGRSPVPHFNLRSIPPRSDQRVGPGWKEP